MHLKRAPAAGQPWVAFFALIAACSGTEPSGPTPMASGSASGGSAGAETGAAGSGGSTDQTGEQPAGAGSGGTPTDDSTSSGGAEDPSSTDGDGGTAEDMPMATTVELEVECVPDPDSQAQLVEILSLEADPQRGANEYLNACSFCHAFDGMGKELDMGVMAPAIAELPWTCEQIETMISGVPETPMVGFMDRDNQWLADMLGHITVNL